MYCTKCGKELKDNIKFCNYCGADLRQEEQNTTGNVSKRKVDKGIIWLIAVIVVLLVVVTVWVVAVLSNKNEMEQLPVEGAVTEEMVTEMVEASETTEAVDEEEATEELEEPSRNLSELSVQECTQLVDDMLKSEFSDTAISDDMLGIVDVIVKSRVAESRDVCFSDLSDDEKCRIDYWIGDSVYTENSITADYLYFDDSMKCDAQSLLSLIKDIYGAEDIPDTEKQFCYWVDDETIQFNFGDGDERMKYEGAQIREQEDCYLLTTPIFKEDNVSYGAELMGYADVLFAKNENSRFGVTAVYARTREAEDIAIDSVETSSVLESQAGKTYEGANLIDGDYSTAWVEGVNGVGIGETITLHLNGPTEVFGVLLYNGYLDSVDLYNKNGKVTKVSVDFGNGVIVEKEVGTTEPQLSEDSIREPDMNIGQISLEQSMVTDTITITILDAVAGDKYDDTCISEMVVY